MRYIKAFICFGISFFLFMTFQQIHNSTVVSVLKDVTDSIRVKPEADKIIHYLGLSDDKWGGAYFKLSTISDVSLTSPNKASINYENPWLSNELERMDKIEKFEAQISEIIEKSDSDLIGKSQSLIYSKIAKELIELKPSPLQSRVLIVYSDLVENQKSISFYKDSDFDRLISEPESVKAQLEKLAPLPKLYGIKVIFVYQPVDTNDDERYTAISNIYKEILEEKGATVEIVANI